MTKMINFHYQIVVDNTTSNNVVDDDDVIPIWSEPAAARRQIKTVINGSRKVCTVHTNGNGQYPCTALANEIVLPYLTVAARFGLDSRKIWFDLDVTFGASKTVAGTP